MLQEDGKTTCAWAMAMELWLCFHVTREGAWDIPSHICMAEHNQQWLLLLPPLTLPSASHSLMLILLGTKQAVFGNCCCVILGFFVEFSGVCFCGKSMQKCDAKHSKCYLCHPDLTIQCIIPQYLTAQSHAVLFHKAPASLAVQHEWCVLRMH